MHYSPCGHGVDWGRRCYSTTARPFRDSDIEVSLNWYPADMSKGPLPFPSKICSLDWMAEKHTKEGVGEVWNTPRPFRNRRKPLGIKGNHICGTADEFRNGEVLDVSRPITKYNSSGVPLCCDPSRREADVKFSITSNSSYQHLPPYRRSGTATVRSGSRTISTRVYRSDTFIGFKLSATHTEATIPVRGGTATVRSGARYVSNGPREVGGLAAAKNGSSYTHVPPTDSSGLHTTCETAYPSLAYATLIPWDITHVGSTYFLLPYSVAGAVNHLRLLRREPLSLSFNLWKGTCGSLELVPFTPTYDWRKEWTQPEDGQLLLELITDQTFVREDTFEIFMGPAPDPLFSTP